MTKSKTHGGIGLPNFRQYYYAIHIMKIVDWNCHADTKHWIHLERSFTTSPLEVPPWIPLARYTRTLLQHPLIGATLEIFHLVTKREDISSSSGPLTPLTNITDFTPGINNKHISMTSGRPFLATHCFKAGIFKLKSTLSEEFTFSNFPSWTYRYAATSRHMKQKLCTRDL